MKPHYMSECGKAGVKYARRQVDEQMKTSQINGGTGKKPRKCKNYQRWASKCNPPPVPWYQWWWDAVDIKYKMAIAVVTMIIYSASLRSESAKTKEE